MASPLLVFGPRSPTYDFGPSHPLTPRRFGPGIDLLRAIGAEPGLAPEPATDDELRACHTAAYIAAVKRISELGGDPWGEPEFGIGPGDDPPFLGMHEAGAAVAGGSLRAIEAILRGDVEHAFHPGGGLHHAMPGRASGFCIYDDPALAIASARAAGLRVLYVDLDVHHGDGVEAIHRADPGVLTFSIHESGRYLFPGTGFVSDVGEGDAAGSVVNVPLEPGTGETAWLGAVEGLLPEIAAAFGPDIVVSQHGCDTHALDPLAHLNVTTTAMGAAARLVDAIAHRRASGRWLSTGGGGYGVYRVVPRAWSHVWLAAAHREAPDRIPAAWRDRWAAEAARYGDRELPETFDDPPNAGIPLSAAQEDAESRSLAIGHLARQLAVPRFIRDAVDSGRWSPLEAGSDEEPAAAGDGAADAVEVVPALGVDQLKRVAFAPRLVANLAPSDLRSILATSDWDVSAAVAGSAVVGLVVSAAGEGTSRSIVAVGVAPGARRRGLASRLLAAHLEAGGPATTWDATVTVAERDPVEPLARELRTSIAERLFARAGFRAAPPDRLVGEVDRGARRFVRP